MVGGILARFFYLSSIVTSAVNSIDRIKGQWVELVNPMEIKSHAVDLIFTQAFKSHPISMDPSLFSGIPKLVTDAQNSFLLTSPSNDEIEL